MAPNNQEDEDYAEFKLPEDTLFVFKNYSPQKIEQRSEIKAKLHMPIWNLKEDIVVSGMSGRFPESDSIEEFHYNLFNNIDMIVEDEKRWPFGYLGLPRGSGKIKDVSLFDHRFFKVDENDANFMDSQVRIMHEIVFEALWDAGLTPESLAGTKTGVFLGNCFDEYLAAYSEDAINIPSYRNCFYAMLANAYDFHGPSTAFDTACASGFSALHEAVVSLRCGQCERAVVLGLNLSLRAATQQQFLNMNMISPDGHCKCLDDDANGYAKGEACVAFILQARSEAKRVYATIIHTKTNCDGFKDLGITFPSFELQRDLIEDTYKELKLDPLEIEYCEAHCTGTQAGDPSEMRAIQESMCKGRTKPLLIGAIKSVIGHTEASSGLCSLVKTLLTFENEMIPANMHMKKLNHRIEGLMTGILKPITENTPFFSKYIALNCFGFGGVNVHAVLQKHEKDQSKFGEETLPRLVPFCGRNQKTLENLYRSFVENPSRITPDLLSLLNDISKTTPFMNKSNIGMRYRGYFLMQQDSNGVMKPFTDLKVNKVKFTAKKPICFVFTGMGCQWTAMGKDLTQFEVMKNSLEKCSAVLKSIDSNFDLMGILTSDNARTLRPPVHSFVAIAAIQIALLDQLEEFEITPDYILGHSIGELTSAYADKCLTLEETIACAYWRGKCVENAQTDKPGAMAAIGCSWEDAVKYCEKFSPNKVWPACNNGIDSVTVSGTKEEVDEFIEKVQQEDPDMFARIVNSSGMAFHCPLLDHIQKDLLSKIENVLKKTKRERSTKWISTTYLSNENKFDAQYLVDNLIQPVRFYEATQQVPHECIFVEIAPHHLLQPIIKRNMMSRTRSQIVFVPTLTRLQPNVTTFLENIGLLYSYGVNPKTENLYPKFNYPVGRGTANLNSFINWRHDKNFTVTQYPNFFNVIKQRGGFRTIDIGEKRDKFVADHCIDGRVLYPATGYVYLVYANIASILNVTPEELSIGFTDVHLHRATIIPKSGTVSFDIRFLSSIGSFVIQESGTTVVTGKFEVLNDNDNFLLYQDILGKVTELEGKPCVLEMESKDIYKEFRLRGYDYGPEFQSIERIKIVDKQVHAKILYKNWITFVDSMVQLAVLGKQLRGLFLPVRIDQLRCNGKLLQETVASLKDKEAIDVVFDGILNIGVARGIEFKGIKANLAPRKLKQNPVEEAYEFVARDEKDMLYVKNRVNSIEKRKQLTELLKKYEHTCIQFLTKEDPSLIESFDKEAFEKELGPPVMFEALKELDLNTTPIDEQILEKIEDDIIFRTHFSERFIRSHIEMYMQTISGQAFNVTEINAGNNILSKFNLKMITLCTFKPNINYKLCHPAPEKLPADKLSTVNTQVAWTIESSSIPSEISNQDLVCFVDTSMFPLTAKQHVDFEKLLDSLWGSLKDGKDVLVLLRDKLFPIEQQLKKMLNLEIDNSSRVEKFMVALKRSSFQLISQKNDVFGVHVFSLKKNVKKINPEDQVYITITNEVSDWFDTLQQKLQELANTKTKEEEVVAEKSEEDANKSAETVEEPAKVNDYNIWLLSNDKVNGMIGFMTCLLREPYCDKVRCILNQNEKEPIDQNSEIVKEIVKTDIGMTVINREGVIGCYQHYTMSIEDYEPIPCKHCYLNVATRGDLSSLRWFESQHKHWPKNRKPEQALIHVYYAPLNFRDVMLASGKLPPDALPDDMGLDDCILGLEFAGRDENGNRVMGMVPSKGLGSTVVMKNTRFLWPIPAHWSMEDASTTPVAYSTAYYALIIRGQLQRGEKVLIHSGSGAVGQASISICLHYGCKLFITVGSEDKRFALMDIFPELKPNQFASSRDTNFEQFIMQATNGEGVDIVLNSLAEEKLQSSVNCLAKQGRFLEIGKFDLSQNNDLDICKLMKNQSFHGILLDNLLDFGPNVPKAITRQRNLIWDMMDEGIKNGIVRPLNRTIFAVDKYEEAFRYMASGKHTGKVVICIREEEKPDANGVYQGMLNETFISALPRTVFLSDKCYIVTGGLGGFGLELILWMIEREARNFVVTSRTGIKDLYQKTRLDYFASRGATIKIFTQDTTNEEGAEALISEAETLGEVGGVFHLAMILKDGLFDNQSLKSFNAVLQPKSVVFTLLDKITRRRCSKVDYFVAFSSVSCGMGNPGQTNYGFANSTMERICEQRRVDGLHGFAIQWGPIGDVGYIIDNVRGNEIVVCGSIPQRMPSCLSSLDRLLQTSHSVCSNLIKLDYVLEAGGGKASLIKTVANILGVKDYEKLEPSVTLGELGMDSLMGVEVKQAIERDYDVALSMQDVRKLTIGRILEISAGQSRAQEGSCSVNAAELSIDDKLLPSDPFIYLNDILNGDPIIFMPQLDGDFELMIKLAKKLNRPAVGLNWTKDCVNLDTVEDTAAHFIKVIEEHMPNLSTNYDLIGYSFGGIISVEMALQLQAKKSTRLGLFQKLILLDSAPKQYKIFVTEANKTHVEGGIFKGNDFIETTAIFLMNKFPVEYEKVREDLKQLDSIEKRILYAQDTFNQYTKLEVQTETIQNLIQTYYNKVLMIHNYDCEDKFNGDIMLIRASECLIKIEEIVKPDYWISDVINGACHLHIMKGDHKTFISDNRDAITKIIRDYID